MLSPTTRAACTIVSPNYLAFARIVARSYLAAHPGERFFVLLVADLLDASAFAGEIFTPVLLGNIGLDNLRAEAMKYDILELNTNVKPTFLKHLLVTNGLQQLTYLDPDIFVYAPFTPIFEALAENDVVITPHMTAPVFDGRKPGEQDVLFNGTYNLGFIAVRNSPDALRMLDWWELRCLDLGFSEGPTGLFVDKKWINMVTGQFEHVRILRHPGCNMAYWNLHERMLIEVDGGYAVKGPDATAPLCFFHFSGIVPSDPTLLSKHTDRFTLADRPDLAKLFRDYKAAVLAAKDSRLETIPYGFDHLSDGTTITRLARRLFSAHQAFFGESDPFDAAGPFAKYAQRAGLVAGRSAVPKATWNEFSTVDRRVALVHRLLALALRVLGPHRYELLMRYLGHISVLRHQAVFLKPPTVKPTAKPAGRGR